MDIRPDWNEWLEFLNKNEVDFVIIGAYAVAHHGVPRLTGDLDVLVFPSAENAERVLQALEEFGFGSLGLEKGDFEVECQTIQLGFPPGRIDILTSVSGVANAEVFRSAVPGLLGSHGVRFISRELLLRNKLAAGRSKDVQDVARLLEIQADAEGT
jgi:hypothetical protein